MSEIIVAVIGLLGIVATYYFKKPERKKEDVNTTIENLRKDLLEAKNDAHVARGRAIETTSRLEVLEDRDRRRYAYELRHRMWDMQVLLAVRTIDENFPDPPPFSLIEFQHEIYEGEQHGNLD